MIVTRAFTFFLVGILYLTITGSGPSANPLLTSKVLFGANATPTPLPENAEIVDLNFRKDWQAGYERSKKELTRRRESWEARNLSSYDFVTAKYQGGLSSSWNRSPVRIKVREGRPASLEVVDKSDASLLARTDGFEEFDTVPKLFDYLLAELEKGNIVSVEYDRRFGYPKRSFVTFTYRSNHNVRSIVISRLLISEKN